MMKGSVHEEDIIILNVYALQNVASKYVKQNPKESRRIGQIHKYGQNFNTRLLEILTTSQQNISRAVEGWKIRCG